MPALDGLCGVAIPMVILTHATFGWVGAMSLATKVSGWPATFTVPGWVRTVAVGGGNGVTPFFVVSAFTPMLSLAHHRDGWTAYAVRRAARVALGHWLAGLLCILAYGNGPRQWAPEGTTAGNLLVAALFGSAWQGGGALGMVPGGWSVSCKAAFHAALLLWLTGGRLWRAAALAALAVIGVQLGARHTMAHGGWLHVPHDTHPVTQAPAFPLGIAAAMLVQRVRLSCLPGAASALLALALAVAAAFVPLSPVREWQVLPQLQFAALVAAAVALVAAHPPRWLASPVMWSIGEVSHSIHLVHFAVQWPSMWLAERVLPADDWLIFALHVMLTTAASHIVARGTCRWVEQPGIRLGARLCRALRPGAGDGLTRAPAGPSGTGWCRRRPGSCRSRWADGRLPSYPGASSPARTGPGRRLARGARGQA